MKRILFSLLGILIVAAAGAAFWYFSLLNSFDQKILAAEKIRFTVGEGSTLTLVARQLEERGLIQDSDKLVWLDRLEGPGTLFAGDYELMPDFTLRDLYRAVTTGDALSDERVITIVEGLTLDEIGQVFAEEGAVDSADTFVTAASSGLKRFTSQYEFLSSLPQGASLEGYLFPDTYNFFRDATVDDVIHKMLKNFEKKVESPEGTSLHEAIILASIVEAEVPHPEDMKTVAGIFTNRLNEGMALQADSTINYITRSGRARSTLDDLEIDSPYNTYKYSDLPPGPISNPGLNAIKAALNPAQTDYYFFLTDKAGRIYYAETLAEHNENRQYLDRE